MTDYSNEKKTAATIKYSLVRDMIMTALTLMWLLLYVGSSELIINIINYIFFVVIRSHIKQLILQNHLSISISKYVIVILHG